VIDATYGSLILCHNSRHDLGGDDLATADGAKSFPCGRLDTHLLGFEPEVFGHDDLHFFSTIPKTDGVTHDDTINIPNRVAIRVNHVSNDFEKLRPGRSFVRVIGRRKVVAYVAKSDSAEKRITDGVTHNIGIGVPIEPTRHIVKMNTAKPKLATLDKRVNIPTDSRPVHVDLLLCGTKAKHAAQG
jgi:hypothetical protein